MDMARKKNSSETPSRHVNRNAQQDKTGRGKVKDRHGSRTQAGTDSIMSDRAAASEDYNLSWFKPTEAQREIIHSMCVNDLTACQGSSGVGKSTTAIWQALNEMKRGNYKRIVFIKTPAQVGDDDLGALKGDVDTKLFMHWVSMKSIFHTFMSKQKLEAEERAGRILFTIPNFIAGQTLDNTLIIIDESQLLSPKTVKLLLERGGESSRVVIMGDFYQQYATKYRKDGFTDFVEKITYICEETGERLSKEDTMGFVQLHANENMRSALSRRIVELYEENSDI